MKKTLAIMALLALVGLLGAGISADVSAQPAYTVDAYSHFNTHSVSAQVGVPFTFDLYTNSGSNGVVAQQSYLLFDPTQLQVVIPDGQCTARNLVQSDNSIFNVPLQNDICNGPGPCTTWRGVSIPAGSIAYASGRFSTPATGDFPVAHMTFCAVSAGTSSLHWEFYPESPAWRDTNVVDTNGLTLSSPRLYEDVTIASTLGQGLFTAIGNK